MAEAMCRKLIAKRLGCKLSELEDRGVIVVSAGIAAMMGGRPSPETVEVMARMELDVADHSTQPLTEQLVRQADLIYVMTRAHRQAILAGWPEAGGRTKMLCRDGSDVPDPIGGPIEQYERCAEQIQSHLRTWVDELDL